MIKGTKKLIVAHKRIIKNYRLSNGKNPKTITTILEGILVDFGINRAKYHGGDLRGTSIIRLFQNAETIFKAFSIETNKFVTKKKQKYLKIIQKDIEICTLFDSLFSLSRTLCGEISKKLLKS